MATLFAIDQDQLAPEVLPVSTLFAIDQDQTAPEVLPVSTLFAIDQDQRSNLISGYTVCHRPRSDCS